MLADFSQVEGIDYNHTYAPVVTMETIRIFMHLITTLDLEVRQFDIKTAFINADLAEEIFMEQPEGFAKPGKEDHVCLLKKSLYGLKQASREWNKTFTAFLKEYGFEPTRQDPCLLVARRGGKQIYLLLYVDDGLVIGDDGSVLEEILDTMRTRFEITVAQFDTFVGMQIARDREKKLLRVHQERYTKAILKRFRLEDVYHKSVPANPHVRLNKEMHPRKDEGQETPMPYREAVGCLMYLAHISRPDIAYAVSQLSRFMAQPHGGHWSACVQVMQYLKGTTGHGINFSGSPEDTIRLRAFSDADYAECLDSRRSHAGVLLLLDENPVAWCSRKQSHVTTSTCEAELVAAGIATKDIVWMRNLLAAIGFPQEDATDLMIDSTSAISVIKSPDVSSYKKLRHVDVITHFVNEKYKDLTIDAIHVSSQNELADIFTKPLTTEKFRRFRFLMKIF